MVQRSKKALQAVNANIAGVILNQVDTKDSSYYYSNYYTK